MNQTLTRRQLARLITRIENGEAGAQTAMNELYNRSGRARTIGITGAPGSGKSTLVTEMVKALRAQPLSPQVAIVAVDPSSPFSGGAILGDRIRMRDLSGDPGVFIRSMASRGALGGIAAATTDVVTALDASGFDIILIETVGAGQLEVDVARIAQTVLVVEAPGNGDEVQAVKAGILEIADIIVVNKADREGVAQTISALQSALDLGQRPLHHHGLSGGRTDDRPAGNNMGYADNPSFAWQVPIIATSALNHTGTADVLDTLDQHARYLLESGEGELRRLDHLESDINERLRELLLQEALRKIAREDYRQLLAAVVQRNIHPAEAARLLLDTLAT